jgi:hypothetical protein
MRALIFIVIAALATAGCSNTTPSSKVTPASTPPAANAISAPGGCGSTQAHKGGVPAWVEVAGAHNNPDFLPYVITDPPIAAAFLWASPLRAGHPENPSNKILWVVGPLRDGADLRITGHPAGALTPTIRTSQPANSAPGEIYPSIVDVPTAGCWHFDLSWAGHRATAELAYS